ncbi:MAG: copper homeostasis protein CutC, partial [Prevotella fusca]|uniref:copper homeostasis protein CutC n=1 Tax=Prevotella fusca TaxID=589436 RepID=UPI003F9F8B17
DIDLCRDLGVDGVVFGCLTADGDIDLKGNEYLMSHAKGMSVTFHRAFDRCREPEKALEQLITLGFDRVLTSGQQPTAEKGIPMLQRLNQLSNGRIKIMAGCGVNEKNIARIRQETSVPAFHFSAREPQSSRMTYSNPSVYMGADEDTIMLTTERRVRKTIDALMGKMA